MARFFLCEPETDESGKQRVFAINLDRVTTIRFVLIGNRCTDAELELDDEFQVLRGLDAASLYSVLK